MGLYIACEISLLCSKSLSVVAMTNAMFANTQQICATKSRMRLLPFTRQACENNCNEEHIMHPSKEKTPYQYFNIGKLTPTDTKLHLYRSDNPSCKQPYYMITSLIMTRHTTLKIKTKIKIPGQLPQAWNKLRECLLPIVIKLDPSAEAGWPP